MGRSQRHMVYVQGYASDDSVMAQGLTAGLEGSKPPPEALLEKPQPNQGQSVDPPPIGGDGGTDGGGSGGTFPDSGSVGYKPSMGTLTNSTGNITTTAAGQVIELMRMQVGHYIRINHPNCIVRKCEILSGDFYDVKVDPSVTTGTTTIEDNTFDNSAVRSGAGGGTAIQGSRMLVRRNKIIKCENGLNLDGPQVVITGNYIGQLAAAQPGDLHTDGIQIDGGISDVNIGGNTIECTTDGTSAVMIDNQNGPCANILVDGNKLSGGSYCVYSDGQKSGAAMTNIQFTNNIFPTPYGQNGAGTISGQGAASVVWANNRKDSATGATIPKP